MAAKAGELAEGGMARRPTGMRKQPIPAREDWGDLGIDPEVRSGYRLYGGRSRDEALPLFAASPIERAAELRFAPTTVFNYYVFCFADVLSSPAGAGAADAASCFVRLAHFLKRVVDWETVWGLRDEAGWVAVADSEGHSSFPVWPHPRYAAACADHEWAGNAPAAIDVRELVEQWLPAMASDNVSLAVFPTPGLRGVIVSAAELAAVLRRALAEYE